MKKRLISFAAAAFACVSASIADPYIGYVYPSGIQAGTTNRFVVGGQGFFGILDAGVTGGGVHVLSVERMAQSAPPTGSQRQWLRKWLDGIIERGDSTRPEFPTNAAARVDEWTVNAWWTTLDQLDRRELEAVERDIYVPKNPLQAAPSLRQIAFVTIAADADAKPGVRQICMWMPSGISGPRPFLVTSEPHVEEPPYAPQHRKKKTAPARVESFPAVLDGRVFPGETDVFELVLRKGDKITCKAVARELQPYIGDAVPGFFNAVMRLVAPDGREIAFSDDCDRFRPDPEFSVEIPEDGDYRLEIRDNLFRGREDFVYSVRVGKDGGDGWMSGRAGRQDAAAAERQSGSGGFSLFSPSTWFGCSPAALSCGTEAKGNVPAGIPVSHPVRLEGPGEFVFDLRARRDGSTLDGVLELKDADGKTVWRHDDVTNALFTSAVAQSECDPAGTLVLGEGEVFKGTVDVSDATGHGGDGYFYTLSLRRMEPGFKVYTGRSSMILRNGTRQTVPVHVVRQGGFDGPVTLLETGMFRFEDGYIPAGTNEARTVFVGKTRTEGPLTEIRISAIAEIDGRAHVEDVIPADECMQAFAWRHLLPAETFLVKPFPLWPPRVNNLKHPDTLTLAGSAAIPGVLRDVRVLLATRHPYRAPDVAGVPDADEIPAAPGCRPVLLTPFPYDQYGVLPATNGNINGALAKEAREIRKLASERRIALVDIHDPLTTLLRERPRLHLCGKDRRTPAPEAELFAAIKVFESLGEGSEVAYVSLDAATLKEDTRNAQIRNISGSPDGVSFGYVARALPVPATDAYRRLASIWPLTAKFNRETLLVKKLKPGNYRLLFDGREVGRFPAAELEKGINIALLDTPGQRLAMEIARKAAAGEAVTRKAQRPKPVRVEVLPDSGTRAKN